MNDPVILFLENVKNNPGHLAVAGNSDNITYKTIGTLAKRIAASLANTCEYPKVAIYLQKGAEAYAAMFGTLMAGGYYTPINIDAPLRRHIDILQQFRPDIVISTDKLVSNLPNIKFHLIDINHLTHDELTTTLPAHELAYVIFTSGSTGHPKGVMISRSALAHYTKWAINAMCITKDDKWSQHPNIAFDLSVLDIYGALCGGATLYPIISKKDKLLPAGFIKRNKLTIWNSVPSVIDLMSRIKQVTSENLTSLRLITFCGEPLYQRHLDAIFAANRNVVVHNTYGPTEATVSCTLLRLTADNYKNFCENNTALGHPIKNMKMFIDQNNKGEIILAGPQLAKGYWMNTTETEKSFSFMTINDIKERIYRTGDTAIIKNGNYYFTGRIDSQVKIRGHRVELEEIDSTIARLKYGNSCTILENEQLHCFIETNKLPDLQKIKKTLSLYLPDYEIPEFIYGIPCLPRTQNDKIDKNELINIIKHRKNKPNEI